MTYSSSSSYRLPSPQESSARGLESRLQDQLFLTVEEIGILVSSQNRATNPRTCRASSLPSYDSCLLNMGPGDASCDYVTGGRRTSDASVRDDVSGREGMVCVCDGPGDCSDDLPPSYEDATKGLAWGHGHCRGRLPSLPPAYQEVIDQWTIEISGDNDDNDNDDDDDDVAEVTRGQGGHHN